MVPFLAATTWIAHFLLSSRFGLYEDDWWFIGYALGGRTDFVLDNLKAFVTWPQGRPFGFFLPPLLAYLGDRMDGLQGIYVLGFLIVAVNTCLFYALLRCHYSALVGLAGALAFCLFPADTTKSLLTHDFQLQPSLTFLLVAGLLYFSGRTPLAYVVSVGSLLSYESPYPVFMALPLLRPRWDAQTLRKMLLHGAAVVALFLTAVVIRQALGEFRVVSATRNVAEIVPLILSSLVRGPLSSLQLLVYGPIRGPIRFLPSWDAQTIVVVLTSTVVFSWVLIVLARRTRDSDVRSEAQLLVAGSVMLVLGYLLSFTHYPPDASFGRATSVHLAATLGVSAMFGAVVGIAVDLGRRRQLSELVASLAAVYLAIVMGYRMTIQRDFARSWALQRAFWSDVARVAPDAGDSTVLVFEGGVAPERWPVFVEANSWADSLVLALTYQYPTDWLKPPRLFTVHTDWMLERDVRFDGSRLVWNVPIGLQDEHQEVLPESNVILLRLVDGELTRVPGPIYVDGRSFSLKAPAPERSHPWPAGRLHDYLLST